jgi:hypothetical protein
MTAPGRESCIDCMHFNHSASAIEAALPNLASLSSAYAAVRADDGLCKLHDRYVAAGSVCAEHRGRRYAASTSTRQS